MCNKAPAPAARFYSTYISYIIGATTLNPPEITSSLTQGEKRWEERKNKKTEKNQNQKQKALGVPDHCNLSHHVILH